MRLLPFFLALMLATTSLFAIELEEGHPYELWHTESIQLQFPKDQEGLWEVEIYADQTSKCSIWESTVDEFDIIQALTCYIPSLQCTFEDIVEWLEEDENMTILHFDQNDVLFRNGECDGIGRIIFTDRAYHAISYYKEESCFDEDSLAKWLNFLQEARILRLM